MTSDVFVVKTAAHYPSFPYNAENPLLSALRSLFLMWGKDPGNPFKEWIGPGARVVIKPNWVHHHSRDEKNLDALVTHTSLIKHVIDLVALGLRGSGSIIIGDAPLQSCDFDVLVKRTRIAEMVEEARRRYSGLEIVIEDWRLTILEESDAAQKHRPNYESRVTEDYKIVDLATKSFLEDISDYSDKFRVTCYDPHLMAPHHHRGKHEYLVTRRVFDADLVINLPKMKTHIKAGLTGALKNLVGINGHKEYLPHHILGGSETGGDCYYKAHAVRDIYDSAYDKFWTRYDRLPEIKRKAGELILGAIWRASRLLTGDSISAGSWYGNETIWRMTLDLNHLLYFCDQAPKKIISIVDGIVAGEGEGPLRPKPKLAGLIVAGENPAYIDSVLAKLMGYNISRIPTVYHAIYHRKSQFSGPYLDNLQTYFLENGDVELVPFSELPNFDFVKPEHWKRATSTIGSTRFDADPYAREHA